MNAETTIDRFAKMESGSTLMIQRWLPGPADRIWRYLTDSDLRSKWLASGDMTLVPGAALELVWRNDNLSAPDDQRPDGFSEENRMQSQIIAVDPMRLLTFAWGEGSVTFELQPKGDKVLLTVTHTGLDKSSVRSMIAAGWHMHLDILVAQASGEEAGSFWSGWSQLRETYEARV